jgi:hypothetical protein
MSHNVYRSVQSFRVSSRPDGMFTRYGWHFDHTAGETSVHPFPSVAAQVAFVSRVEAVLEKHGLVEFIGTIDNPGVKSHRHVPSEDVAMYLAVERWGLQIDREHANTLSMLEDLVERLTDRTTNEVVDRTLSVDDIVAELVKLTDIDPGELDEADTDTVFFVRVRVIGKPERDGVVADRIAAALARYAEPVDEWRVESVKPAEELMKAAAAVIAAKNGHRWQQTEALKLLAIAIRHPDFVD